MNFFESQDTAKRNTGKLIFLFVFAVVSLIIVTNLLVMLIFGFLGTEMTSMAATQSFELNWEIFLGVGVVVSGVVLIGSLYKIATLSGGGARVAEMMDGRLLISGTDNLNEKRALNVVEEMAIASGTPVPPVYLMEEEGINAFAAGYSPSDAVIGVTRGAIDTLSRDELQGVIAHEFSHILHGDMRINIRLIGVLHGIMVLGLIGYHLMRSGSYRRRSKDSGGIFALGLGLMVVGWVGTFFGNLIKAAVSRQREYLADASAVQFTRNPEGIAGALMQIAQHSQQSYLSNPKSSEINHALFEEARVSRLGGLHATHPPLDERIEAILPSWNGNYEYLRKAGDKTQLEEDAAPVNAEQDQQSRQEKLAAVLTGAAGVMLNDSIIDQVGDPDDRQLTYAGQLIESIPQVFLDAAHEPSGARAVIYFLVLSKADATRQQQLSLLAGNVDAGVFPEIESLIKSSEEILPEQRIALVEIALSSLRQLSKNQYDLFKKNFDELIALDSKVNLLEWALQKIVFHHLMVVFEKGKIPGLGKKDIKSCVSSISILLTILVHSNKQEEGITIEGVFKKGTELLGFDVAMLDIAEINFEKLNSALDDLTQLKPLQKPALLKACVACITADRKVATIEVELLRAIAATIDCPMPPLVKS
jgi:Zn-dependent protease with chaperone function